MKYLIVYTVLIMFALSTKSYSEQIVETKDGTFTLYETEPIIPMYIVPDKNGNIWFSSNWVDSDTNLFYGVIKFCGVDLPNYEEFTMYSITDSLKLWIDIFYGI